MPLSKTNELNLIMNENAKLTVEHSGGDGWTILHGDMLLSLIHISDGDRLFRTGDLLATSAPTGEDGTVVFDCDPVSYTHLDVYKRQVLILTPFAMKPVGFCKNRNSNRLGIHKEEKRLTGSCLLYTSRCV